MRFALRELALVVGCHALASGTGLCAEIHVLVSGAFTRAYRELVPQFERNTGHTVVTAYGASMGGAPNSIPSRLDRGERADVVILAAEALQGLIEKGQVRAESRVDLVRSRIGVAVRAGAPQPDISSMDALKRTLLQAKSIAYSASASGTYLSTELFPQMGIAEQIKSKAKRIVDEPVGVVVARGDAEIGFQQISELLPIPGIDLMGPLPPEAQRATAFSAGVTAHSKEAAAAGELVRFFTAPAATAAIAKSGLEPVHPADRLSVQQAGPLLPGQDLTAGMFGLREMDMHLHAGMERPVDLATWINLAVADGRRVLLLLDHLELYRKTPQQYEAWRSGKQFQARYPLGAAGHAALFTGFDEVIRRSDVLAFKGWEIDENELDSGVEAAAIRMADAVGWHISPRNGAEPPNGQTLLKRVRQIKELQKQFPIPMILLHPFPMRLENIQRTAKSKGRDLRTITVEEYRFFRPGEQEELIRLLQGTSIYIEINRDTERYFDDPACREALIADTLPLVRGGVQFTVSTDNHHLMAAQKRFDPDHYCERLGITPRNTNTIVRELLALRARRALE